MGDEKQKELYDKMRQLFIQRFKPDVLHAMPKKIEHLVFCELSEEQKLVRKHNPSPFVELTTRCSLFSHSYVQTYERIRELPDYIALRFANCPCDCGVNENYFKQYQQLQTTAEKTRYRRTHVCKKRCLCCYISPKEEQDAVLWHHFHPGKELCEKCPFCLLLPGLSILNQLSSSLELLQFDKSNKSYDPKDREKREAFAKIAFPEAVIKRLPGGIYRDDEGDYTQKEFFMLSGKLKQLDYLFKKIDREEGRVLLFSGSTQTLDCIQNFVKSEGHGFLRIDGSTPSSKRQGKVTLAWLRSVALMPLLIRFSS